MWNPASSHRNLGSMTFVVDIIVSMTEAGVLSKNVVCVIIIFVTSELHLNNTTTGFTECISEVGNNIEVSALGNNLLSCSGLIAVLVTELSTSIFETVSNTSVSIQRGQGGKWVDTSIDTALGGKTISSNVTVMNVVSVVHRLSNVGNTEAVNGSLQCVSGVGNSKSCREL